MTLPSLFDLRAFNSPHSGLHLQVLLAVGGLRGRGDRGEQDQEAADYHGHDDDGDWGCGFGVVDD